MCPLCHRNLVEIEVRLADINVTMHACSTCETRWWDRDGCPVGLDTILLLASDDASTAPTVQADRG